MSSTELDSKTVALNFEKGGLLKSRYKSLGKLNEGSYGIVYLAEDIFTKEKVAVKYIFSLLDSDSSGISEAEKEIDIYLKLGYHKNIASLIDYFDSFLILEYCEKGDLYDLIKAGEGPKTRAEIIDIMIQLIDLIAFCHNRGIYHRDIKPENIFITGNNQIKLGDWGLATTERYCADFDVGSDRYMAPELFDSAQEDYGELEELSDGHYDASKVDIWALGICFLNIIFHKNPFSIANSSDKMFLNFCANREILFDIFSTMSVDLFNVLRHSLAINPENRNLSSMKSELQRLEYLTYDEEEYEEVSSSSSAPTPQSAVTIEVYEDENKEQSSFTTKNAKPININKHYQKHRERQPLSIQTPNRLFVGSMNSSNTAQYKRQDLYTPPSKRFLDPSHIVPRKQPSFDKKRDFASHYSPRKSNLTYISKSYEPRHTNYGQDDGNNNNKNKHRSSKSRSDHVSNGQKNSSGFAGKRKIDKLGKLDTKISNNSKNVYIPPNLRDKLKSPAFQSKTFTADVYRINSKAFLKPTTSIQKADPFEPTTSLSAAAAATSAPAPASASQTQSQLTDDIVFDDMDDEFVNNLKSLKVRSETTSSTASTTVTPRHSEEFSSTIPSLVSNSSISGLSSFTDKVQKAIEQSSKQNNSNSSTTPGESGVYVPPHHRPDYDASKYRVKGLHEQQQHQHQQRRFRSPLKLLNTHDNVASRSIPHSTINIEGHFSSHHKNFSDSTLSASMPQPFESSLGTMNWADYDDDSDSDEPILYNGYGLGDGSSFLLKSYESQMKKIPSAINVQM